MSAPADKVDVLAVLRTQMKQTQQFGGYPGFNALKQAHEAVAELIEAAKSVRDAYRSTLRVNCNCDDDFISQQTAALDVALARVRGIYPTPSGHDIGCVEHPPRHAQACSCGARVGGDV